MFAKRPYNSDATNADAPHPAEHFMNRIMRYYTKPVRGAPSINVLRNVSLVNIKMFAYMSKFCPPKYKFREMRVYKILSVVCTMAPSEISHGLQSCHQIATR